MGWFSLVVAAVVVATCTATFTMTGYACGQPQLYQQCQCPSFCSGYQPYNYGQYGGSQYDQYRSFVHKHRPRHRHHKKKKFRFDTLEEIDSKEEVPEPLEEVTSAPKTKTNSWDDEDLWESKFVGTKSKSGSSIDEELPEIDSAELESLRTSQTRTRPAPAPAPQPSSAGQGIGVNTGLGIGAPGIGGAGGGLFGISSGVGVGVPGVGPIGVSSGLGIGK